MLAAALNMADLNLPDGSSVAWLGRNSGTTGPVRGPALVVDVMLAGIAEPGSRGVRHYLYGGAEGVATAMAAELLRRDPRIHFVGLETPPYRSLTENELVALADRINRSSADIVWIGLGTPRQDHLIPALAPLVSATLVPIGAAFDFLSGRVPEAPAFLHGSGFEWLYRLLREPRRLWRRYLVDGARFVFLLTAGR
jgi:N-acetylglucosaminyldiphosphoundecaprenol N-acetyl-beta-D-mannosaminyltransferase